MISKESLATREHIKTDKNLFEKVAKGYMNAKDIHGVQYKILDYVKILDEMIEYLNGYKEYTESDDHKYDSRVIGISKNFFEKMFTSDDYKKKINLMEFKDINADYLKKTKELQNLMESYLDNKEISSEMQAMITMTNNQYKKLAKVCKDDMRIYMWLTTSNSKFLSFNITDSLKSDFYNKKTPVMHKVIPK